MLLIPCPYCGERPEIEFAYGGEAHLARPARPAELDDQTWTDYLYMRNNTKGVHAERWRHARGCGALLQRAARHHHRSVHRDLPDGRSRPDLGRPLKAPRECARPGLAHRELADRDRNIDRSRPLRFAFDGRTYEGFAGDTLASALLANGVHLVGRSFKYHRPRGILTAGFAEPNALVTVRAMRRAARRTCAPLRSSSTTVSVAESQNRWPSLAHRRRAGERSALAVLSGRLLLQDLHVAAHRLEELVRASHPPRSRTRVARPRCPIRIDTLTATRIATCWSWARSGGIAAALAAAEVGARVILCDEQPSSAAACSPTTRRASTVSPRARGCSSRSERSRRILTSPRSSAPRLSATSRTTSSD